MGFDQGGDLDVLLLAGRADIPGAEVDVAGVATESCFETGPVTGLL